MEKLRVGIIGATGMVGQRFAVLLADHPYFRVTALAASARSAGKPYREAVAGRWKLPVPMPEALADLPVRDAADVAGMKELVDFVFCAVNMPKADTKALELAYAQAEIPVVSNNSANRGAEDVPMVIPEINDAHLALIPAQKKRLGTNRTTISNCINSMRQCTFTQFVNTYRIRHAQQLMRDNPDKRASEVWMESGFANETSFFRTFKTIVGMTPTEWKNRS